MATPYTAFTEATLLCKVDRCYPYLEARAITYIGYFAPKYKGIYEIYVRRACGQRVSAWLELP